MNIITTNSDCSLKKLSIADSKLEATSASFADDTKRGPGNVATCKNDNNLSVIDETTKKYNKISMIIFYGREVVCVLALILTTYASLQNSPPKLSRAPAPAPFFSKGSLVHDSPAGNLGPTQTRVSLSELSLVLYYAPWCAESQNARSAYEHVARLYYREAHFGAINCWQPGGECRIQYSKVQSWPVLMAYQPNGLAVQYHGPWTHSALSRFVNSLVNPLFRLSDPEDLMQLMTGRDAVVVAFLDTNVNKKQYSKYYQTSLKWLEKDPFQEIGFGIVTGDSVRAFGVDLVPAVRMYLWNETLEYSGNTSWTTTELAKWINTNVQCVSMWLAPPGASKSASIAPYLSQGPIMLLFTPRNLYRDSSDAYSMLRQIGMEYYNCPNDNWVKEMAKEYIADQRRENVNSYKSLQKKCALILKKNLPNDNDKSARGCLKSPKSVSVSFVKVLNSSKFAEAKQKQFPVDYCDSLCDKELFECGKVASNTMNVESCDLPEKSAIYSENYNEALQKTSMLNNEYDFRSPENLKKTDLRKKCELLHLAELEGGDVFYDSAEKENLELISGMACKSNKSFTIMAIDSVLYHTFAERLGVDVLHERNKSVAIIVDHEDESTYILKDKINLNSIVKFLHNYYKRTLSRYLRSNNVSYKNTHYFNLHEFKKENKRVYNERESKFISKASLEYANIVPDEYRSPQHVYLREINSHNFDNVVIKSNKTVVVLFYSAQCAFCNLLSQHLLTMSKILKEQPNLDFVRIDGDKNDLSWEYSMEIFPSLIIFPNGRKSESRIFSPKMQVTLQNVLGFILANLAKPMRLHAVVAACKYPKRLTSYEDCQTILKNEISDGISLSLREWRKMPHKRRQILRRLQLMKRFYLNLLCLNHSCDYNLLENVAKSILKLWKL